MKQCPRCGSKCFCVTAHVMQEWVVDEDGVFLRSNNDCLEVTHFPDDEDVWDCENCGYSAAGKEFNVEERMQNIERTLKYSSRTEGR